MKSNKVVKMMKPPIGEESIAPLVEEILGRLGEDSKRDGLSRTPERVDKALRFLTSGYQMKVEQILNGALYEVKYDEMVVVRDIEFFSLCEHHMLPFYGKMHVAYLPQKKVIGLSKIPRIVDMFARRLQIQERLTQQIANAILEAINAEGVGVIIEARHLCMMMRGVQKQNSVMTTSSILGSFHSSAATRNEFLSLVHSPRP